MVESSDFIDFDLVSVTQFNMTKSNQGWTLDLFPLMYFCFMLSNY